MALRIDSARTDSSLLAVLTSQRHCSTTRKSWTIPVMQRATKRFPNLLTDNVDWIEMGFKSLFFSSFKSGIAGWGCSITENCILALRRRANDRRYLSTTLLKHRFFKRRDRMRVDVNLVEQRCNENGQSNERSQKTSGIQYLRTSKRLSNTHKPTRQQCS